MNAYLHHVTLNTGDARRSPRIEVDDELLPMLAQFVEEAERRGVAEFPSPTGLMVLRRIAESERPSRHLAVWAISEPQGPALVTIALALKQRQGVGLWRALHAIPEPGMTRMTRAEDPPPAPWLAVALHLSAIAPMPHPALGWLGDAERCIAWAWIEKYGRAEE